MAFSRFRRPARRSFGFRPRFKRAFLKRPIGPDGKRWSRANFHILQDVTVENTSDTITTVNVRLAAVDNLSDQTTGFGRMYEQSVRHIELGGIVLGRIIEPIGQAVSAVFDGPSESWVTCREHLTIDRATSTGGSASSGTAPYNHSEAPTASMLGGGSLVESDNFPTKVLWTNLFRANLDVVNVVDLQEGDGAVLENNRANVRGGMLNKRLRYILDDQHNFNYSCSFITGTDYAPGENKEYRLVLSGWLYWRLKF